MIAKANITRNKKALANLFRIFLYLILYIHIIGCYWWTATLKNAPIEFMKVDLDLGLDSLNDCFYMDLDGRVLNITNTDEPYPCSLDSNEDSIWIQGPLFSEDHWTRYTPEDPPIRDLDWIEAGAMPWNVLN